MRSKNSITFFPAAGRFWEGGASMADFEDGRIAGVSPGGVRDPYIVKILICFLMDRVGRPVTEQQLIEVLASAQSVNYFLLTSTFAELKRLGHLREHGGKYTLTPLGEETARKLSSELPVALRERVLETAGCLRQKSRLQRETSVSVTGGEEGYRVEFSFHDGELEFMRLSLYAPDLPQAEKLRDQLLRQYQQLYIDLINRLTRPQEDEGQT